MMRPKQASGKPHTDICWFWLDIHLLLEEALPPRGSSERFEAVSEWEFDKLTPGQSREIIAKAKEFPWRDMPEYRRPVYTQNSNFRDQITGTQSEWTWRSSGANCLWDTAVGYDDHSSVMVIRTNEQPGVSAWYAQFQWHGYLMDTPFDWEPVDLNAAYRISAMVKTKNVTGEVRLAVVNASGSAVLYNNDRYDMKNAQVKKSRGLSGDNDWTELSITFTPESRGWENISLEIEGQGQVWFDNVSIVRLN